MTTMGRGRTKTKYCCMECGYESAGWLGRCPGCGAWNTLQEEVEMPAPREIARNESVPLPIGSIPSGTDQRLTSGLTEFDRVLGGGLVPGSLTLLGGDPGVGKSTLLLQYAAEIARRHGNVLYVSGEESPSQVRLRADRLGAAADGLLVLGETSAEAVAMQTGRLRPVLAVVDSVQTMRAEGLAGVPGSVGQVRACASEMLHLAKETGISIFLVGHITKTGALAGPKVLEHIVDTVLYLEGERRYPYRLLRAAKNRFGSTDELAMFAMEETGLREVANPSVVFLADRAMGQSGTVVYPGLEGTRALLLELQALVAGTGYGTPRRLVSGLDYNRVSLVLAVLERRLGFSLGNQDVYVSLAGGLRLTEPATDLPVALAVVSSLREKPISAQTVVFGEVGLAGEIRPVRAGGRRLAEAVRLGFTRAVMPRGERGAPPGLEIVGVGTVEEALEAVFCAGQT
ncbi:MAG: DNA repair protein RadA [Bacteroidota bacterium]